MQNSFGSIGVTTCRIDSHHRNDIASYRSLHLLTFISMHPEQTAKPFASPGSLVHVSATAFNRTLVKSQVGELAKRFIHDFKCHAYERFVGIRFQSDLRLVFVTAHGCHFPTQWRRQVIDNGIQQLLNSLVAIGGSHEHSRRILVLDCLLGDLSN